MFQFPCAGELRSMLAEFAAGLQSKASKVYSQASPTPQIHINTFCKHKQQQ